MRRKVIVTFIVAASVVLAVMTPRAAVSRADDPTPTDYPTETLIATPPNNLTPSTPKPYPTDDPIATDFWDSTSTPYPSAPTAAPIW